MRARIPALNPADGLNINRMFPGDAGGSASQRTAAWLMELQSESDFYIDMHGGDVHEKLSPYVYIPGACEERVTAAARRAAAFVNVPVRILSSALSGAYNSAAACGTPSILIERGQGGRWSEAEVTEYRADILSVLAHLGTVDGANFAGVHGPVGQTEMRAFYETSEGGFWYPCVEPGEPGRTRREARRNARHRGMPPSRGDRRQGRRRPLHGGHALRVCRIRPRRLLTFEHIQGFPTTRDAGCPHPQLPQGTLP